MAVDEQEVAFVVATDRYAAADAVEDVEPVPGAAGSPAVSTAPGYAPAPRELAALDAQAEVIAGHRAVKARRDASLGAA